MTMLVRALARDEWKVLRDVRLAALRDSPDAFYSSYEEVRQRPEEDWRAWPHQGRAFVAWLDGEPVGMVAVGAHWDPATSSHTDDGSADLFAMWVAPVARGTGVADTLVRAALEWAASAGRHTVDLEVAGGNTRAERLYARRGFQRAEGQSVVADGICMRFRVVTSEPGPDQTGVEGG